MGRTDCLLMGNSSVACMSVLYISLNRYFTLKLNLLSFCLDTLLHVCDSSVDCRLPIGDNGPYYLYVALSLFIFLNS